MRSSTRTDRAGTLGSSREGLALLERSAAGTELTAYHIEAAIAAAHASARSVAETDWGQIVSLYDRLMAIAPSPVVALNRAIADRRARRRRAGARGAARDCRSRSAGQLSLLSCRVR